MLLQCCSVSSDIDNICNRQYTYIVSKYKYILLIETRRKASCAHIINQIRQLILNRLVTNNTINKMIIDYKLVIF